MRKSRNNNSTIRNNGDGKRIGKCHFKINTFARNLNYRETLYVSARAVVFTACPRVWPRCDSWLKRHVTFALVYENQSFDCELIMISFECLLSARVRRTVNARETRLPPVISRVKSRVNESRLDSSDFFFFSCYF